MTTENQRMQIAAGIPIDLLTEGNLSGEVKDAAKNLKSEIEQMYDEWTKAYNTRNLVKTEMDSYEEALYDDEGKGAEKQFYNAYSDAYDSAIEFQKKMEKMFKLSKKVL